MSTTITLTDLTKRFDSALPGGSSTTAVDRVSLTVDAGELFFLLGPSGCGKTTLLRMIAGFIDPTSGSITFKTPAGERDVTHLPPNQRNTGMVFQSYALWPHMTVAQNVAFGLEIRKVSGEEKARRVAEALDAVQMGPYAQRKPTQLSGGQQQRVALARALVIRPDVLLLDEPLSNLDAKLRLELRSEIRRICKEAGRKDGSGGGMTAVYVTHDQKEALSMADRVAIVSAGKVVQVGPPAELYRRPASAFVAEFLGETNFLPATLTGPRTGRGSVQTPAGVLESSQFSPELAASSTNAVCSIRPEAFRVDAPDGTNTLFARVLDSTYLGETAQLLVELPGNTRVRVATLNPGLGAVKGRQLTLSVHPDDVVVLPKA